MLTTDECLNLCEYAFKSSPESCSSNSCFTDYTDLPSDEDFLQQLSSDLDIPLLLNPGEDEMSLLNSFFDKSPEEIMSEIVLPLPQREKIKEESVIIESETKTPNSVQYFQIKDEVKSEPLSPRSHSNLLSPVLQTTGIKRVPIQPKPPFTSTNNKVVVINNTDSPPPAKVVVLENVATVPITTTAINSTITTNCTVPPVIIKNNNNNLALNVGNIDPKALKRQQRKIKNRESACLSRKKKKDYLTSLENQVKDLMMENQKLKQQNMQLNERLAQYEGKPLLNGLSNMKTSIVLCMFLFSVAFNFDSIRNPVIGKYQMNDLPSDAPKVFDYHSRNLLWTEEESSMKNSTAFSPFSMCPAAINQTESARLVLELERWIGKPNKNVAEKPSNITSVLKSKSKLLRKKKQRKFATPFLTSMYSMREKLPQAESNNELQVFSPTVEHLYNEFFEAINRQDDTFYVVSFSDHHMLLPALHHNKTRRPKMSLIMPSMLPNNGNISQPTLVPLMQIDCEVLDTRLIQIRYGSIPQHLRKHNNSTSTPYQRSESVSKSNDNAANYSRKKAYKPYFIKQKSVRANSHDTDFYNLR